MKIIKAKYLRDYEIEVSFSDGQSKVIDLHKFVSESKSPLIRKYLDKSLFANVKVEYGTICWGDNGFDINPENIYNGDFDKKATRLNDQ